MPSFWIGEFANGRVPIIGILSLISFPWRIHGTNGIFDYIWSGQIIATSHDQKPQMVVNCKGNPRLFQGNLGEGEIFFSIWPDGTGIFAYIYDRFRWNVGEITIHGASGIRSRIHGTNGIFTYMNGWFLWDQLVGKYTSSSQGSYQLGLAWFPLTRLARKTPYFWGTWIHDPVFQQEIGIIYLVHFFQACSGRKFNETHGFLYDFQSAEPQWFQPNCCNSHLKIGHPRRKFIFQPPIFSCNLLVSGMTMNVANDC